MEGVEAEGGVFCFPPHLTPLNDEVRERAGEGVLSEVDPDLTSWLEEIGGVERRSALEGEPCSISISPPPPPLDVELEVDNERPPTPFPPIIKDPTHPPSSSSILSSSSSSSLYENGAAAAPSSTLGGDPGKSPPKSRAIPLDEAGAIEEEEECCCCWWIEWMDGSGTQEARRRDSRSFEERSNESVEEGRRGTMGEEESSSSCGC